MVPAVEDSPSAGGRARLKQLLNVVKVGVEPLSDNDMTPFGCSQPIPALLIYVQGGASVS